MGWYIDRGKRWQALMLSCTWFGSIYLCVSVCVSIHSYQSLGQIGCVTEILNHVVLRVLINGKKQTYVALCLLHAPGERISELHITPDKLYHQSSYCIFICALQLTSRKSILQKKVPVKLLLPWEHLFRKVLLRSVIHKKYLVYRS